MILACISQPRCRTEFIFRPLLYIAIQGIWELLTCFGDKLFFFQMGEKKESASYRPLTSLLSFNISIGNIGHRTLLDDQCSVSSAQVIDGPEASSLLFSSALCSLHFFCLTLSLSLFYCVHNSFYLSIVCHHILYCLDILDHFFVHYQTWLYDSSPILWVFPAYMNWKYFPSDSVHVTRILSEWPEIRIMFSSNQETGMGFLCSVIIPCQMRTRDLFTVYY